MWLCGELNNTLYEQANNSLAKNDTLERLCVRLHGVDAGDRCGAVVGVDIGGGKASSCGDTFIGQWDHGICRPAELRWDCCKADAGCLPFGESYNPIACASRIANGDYSLSYHALQQCGTTLEARD